MKPFRAVAIAMAFAAACACSSSRSRTPDQSAVAPAPSVQAASAPRITDPCKLLTQAEASGAAGAKLNPGELQRFRSITRCTFANPTDSGRQIFLDVHDETDPVADATLFDSYIHAPNGKPVSGIGDQAVWTHSEMPLGDSVAKFTSLDILKGGRLVEMSLPGSITTITAGVEKAGKLIAGRI